eukprot:3957883-Amphidinium_carterae.1
MMKQGCHEECWCTVRAGVSWHGLAGFAVDWWRVCVSLARRVGLVGFVRPGAVTPVMHRPSWGIVRNALHVER